MVLSEGRYPTVNGVTVRVILLVVAIVLFVLAVFAAPLGGLGELDWIGLGLIAFVAAHLP